MGRKKSILSVIPSAILFAIILACITYFASDKLGLSSYKAQAKIITNSEGEVSDVKNLALAYAATIDSDSIKNKVIENLDLDINTTDFDNKLTIVPIKGSPIINIIVEDRIKLRAEDMADEYADISVRVLNDLYKADTEVIEYSYNNAGEKSEKERNAIFAAKVGFLFWFIVGSIFTIISNARINRKTKNLEKEDIPVKKEEVKEKSQNIERLGNYRLISEIPEYEEDDLNV